MVKWAYVFISSRQPKKVLRAVRKMEGVIHADALPLVRGSFEPGVLRIDRCVC